MKLLVQKKAGSPARRTLIVLAVIGQCGVAWSDSMEKAEAREIFTSASSYHRGLSEMSLFIRAELEVSEWFSADPGTAVGEEVSRRWRIETVVDRGTGACVTSTTRTSDTGAQGELIDTPRTAHAYRLGLGKEGATVVPTVPPTNARSTVLQTLVQEDAKLADPIAMLDRLEGARTVADSLVWPGRDHLLSDSLPFLVTVSRAGNPEIATVTITLPDSPTVFTYRFESTTGGWRFLRYRAEDQASSPPKVWESALEWGEYSTPAGTSVAIPIRMTEIQEDESIKFRAERRILRAEIENDSKPNKFFEEEAAARTAQAHYEGTLEGIEARRISFEAPSAP